MRFLWTYLKRFLRLLFYAFLVALAFAAGAVVVGFTLTERGRDNLAGLISDFASSPGQTVSISGIDGIWAGPLTVENLVVEDARGPWLALRGVEVEWSPLALFSSQLKSDRIFARRVELARLPQSEGAKSSEGSSLPLSLSLRNIELPDIALGADLSGGVAAISAKGSVFTEAAPLQIETSFQIARTDGQAGAADGVLRFVPDQNLLDLNLRASEPAGGIIANLLKIPGAPPVELALMGSGPASDWKATGSFTVDGAVVTRVEGRHQFTDKGSRIEARGDGEFERFLPKVLRPLLAGKTVFDIAGTATNAGGVDIERASVQSGGLHATASGAIDPQGASDFALQLATDGAGLPLSFGTDESPIDMVLRSASVRAIGDGREPNLDIAASLASVKTNHAEIADLAVTLHSDAFNIRSRTGPVTGNATAAAITIDNPTVAPLIAGKVSVDLAGTLSQDTLTVAAATLASDALSGTFGGDVSLADGSITLDLKADIASSALPAEVRRVLAERTALAGRVMRDAEGHVSAKPFSLSSGGLSAEGSIAMNDDGVDASIQGQVADIGVATPSASGAAAFALTAKGALSSPDVSLTLTSDAITVAGCEFSGLKLAASGKADADNPAANVQLSATLDGQALQGSAVLEGAGGKRELKRLSLAFGSNTLSGDLSLDEKFLPVGTLDFAFKDIAPLAALAGQAVQGDLAGTATFAVDGGVPQVRLDAKASAIARGELSAKDLSVAAVVGDYLATPAISGRLTAASLVSGGTVTEDVDIALSSDGAWTSFDGGATVSGIPARAAGRFMLTDGGVTVELASGEAALPDFKAVLSAPSNVTVADGVTTLDSLAIDVAGGTAVLSGTAGTALDIVGTFSAPQDGAQITFGGAENPINLLVQSASVKIVGTAAEPALDIAASLSRVSTKAAQLENLAIALHSDAFDIAARSGPVTGKATADAFIVANASIAPLVSGKLSAELAGTLSTDALSVMSGTLRSDALNGGFSGDISLVDGSMTLDLKADVVSSALPAAARGVLGQNTTISGKVARDAAGDFSADALSIVSGAFNASGSARVNGKLIDAKLSGALADVALLSPGATGAIAFSLTAAGEAAALDVAVDVTSPRIEAAGREITDLKLTATGKADTANPSADVALTGTVAGEALQGSARLATTDGRREVKGLQLSLGANRITGDLVLDENFLPLGTIDFTLPDIGSLAALAFEKIEGDLAGTATFGNVDGRPALSVDAKTASIVRGDVSARDVSITARIADYLAAPVVSGRIRAANAASGTTVARDVDVTLTRDGNWTGFDGAATVSDIPARAMGRVQVVDGKTVIEIKSAEATVNGIKIPIGTTGIAIENGAAALNNVEIALGGGKATISGTTGENLDLDITLTNVPASLAKPYLPGLDPSGSISGKAKVTGAASDPSASFTARISGAETAQTRAARLGPLEVGATGRYAQKKLTFDATVTGRGGVSVNGTGSVDLADPANPGISIDLKLAGLPAAVANSFAPSLDAAGAISGTVKVTGAASDPSASFTAKISGAETVQTRAARLGPLEVGATGRYVQKKLIFDATVTGRGGVSVNGTGSVDLADPANPGISIDLKLAGLPAAVANGFAPSLDAAGAISGTVKVSGSPSRPSVAYSIDWRGAQTSQTRASGFSPMTVTSNGTFAGGKLTFKANANEASGIGFAASGSVDTSVKAIAVDVSGTIPFSFLTPRLAAQGLSLTGAANASLQVRGPLSSPAIGGTVRTSGARLVHASSGIAINDIAAQVTLSGQTATVNSLTGTLSSGGSISASGTVGTDPGQGFPANLSVRIANGRYTDGRVVTTTMDGDLAIRGPLVAEPVLSGIINLAKTVITVPDRLPGSLATLDVKHKNETAAVRAQDQALRPAAASGGGAGGLTLDVTVNAGNQIFVQGRGLDAELGGSLRLTGSVGAPQAIGQFTLRRGRLSILGKRLTFTRGTITFSGSMVPYLDLAAESSASDATVTVSVNGPANNPKFDFTSTPALPQDEVLARLIFGRSMSNLSPLQIAQLAGAAAQFAGVGGSTTLLEGLRSRLGVDDLDIRTDEKGGTAVAVGKYLNDRTYLTLEKGDKAGSGKARIDLDVGRGVKVRGEANDGGEAKGGIFFEREY